MKSPRERRKWRQASSALVREGHPDPGTSRKVPRAGWHVLHSCTPCHIHGDRAGCWAEDKHRAPQGATCDPRRAPRLFTTSLSPALVPPTRIHPIRNCIHGTMNNGFWCSTHIYEAVNERTTDRAPSEKSREE